MECREQFPLDKAIQFDKLTHVFCMQMNFQILNLKALQRTQWFEIVMLMMNQFLYVCCPLKQASTFHKPGGLTVELYTDKICQIWWALQKMKNQTQKSI